MAAFAFLTKDEIHRCIWVAGGLIQPWMLVAKELTDGRIPMSVCIFKPRFLLESPPAYQQVDSKLGFVGADVTKGHCPKLDPST